MDQRMLQRMMAEAQKKQKEYGSAMEKIKSTIFEHCHGKNHVCVKANGNFEILEIKVDSELLQEKDMMEELVAEAINEVIRKINKEIKEIEKHMTPSSFF